MSEPKTLKGAESTIVLMERINKGNPSSEDLKALSKELDRVPEFWRSLGNYQNNAFESVLRSASELIVLRICGERYVEEMKTELGYHSSTFVEKMLIDEIVMRWLRLATADNGFTAATGQSHSAATGMYHEKRLASAQKSYLKAIETLARVRRMIAQTQAKGAEMFKNLLTETD